MYRRVKSFFCEEDGAVTVDWVVLTAAVVALGGVAIVSIEGASGSVGTAVETGLAAAQVSIGLYGN
ncbi:hypothetical protein [Aestuariivita boseongensis]|uniref:hypothetical protein n=1 Tax=Aestuariivita boseongensis TaxID=1470562 RepID=UPI000682D5BD|nr:hypothetical protein [Aestuariivita boseongensis]